MLYFSGYPPEARTTQQADLLLHFTSISESFLSIPLSNRFLQKYNRNDVLKDFNLEDNKINILFFGGGEFGLGKTRTFELFDTFTKFITENEQKFQMIAIAGKNIKMKSAFEEIVYKYNSKNIKILEFTNKVPELMSISNLVVTKPGGMTTTESLASHLPMVVINPIPGQEEENAEFLEQNGIAIWLKKSDNAWEILNNLFDNPNKLEEMKNNTKKLAKPYSTKTICDILIENLK